MIGYIQGGNVQLIKLLKLTLPFIVVYYFSDDIAKLILTSNGFSNFANKYLGGLSDIAYYNTLVVALTVLFAYIGSYIITSFIINLISKYILHERITFALGRYNQIAGAVFASMRAYIIMCLVVVPFYMLNITNENNIVSGYLLNHPPKFTRIGAIINVSKPTMDTSNKVANFTDVFDVSIAKLTQYYDNIVHYEEKIDTFEGELRVVYDQLETTPDTLGLLSDTPSDKELLLAFIESPDKFINAADGDLREKFKAINNKTHPYKGIIIWGYNEIKSENVDIDNPSDVVQSFRDNYDTIIANTDEQVMKGKLEKMMTGLETYYISKEWLGSIGHEDINFSLLENDALIEILDAFDRDYESKILPKFADYPLVKDKLASMKELSDAYQTKYKKIIADMPGEMDFKLKLILCSLQKVNIVDKMESSPLIAMYVIDTISLLSDNNTSIPLPLIGEVKVNYEQLAMVIVPLYLIHDEDGNQDPITAEEMKVLLDGAKDGVDDLTFTEEFVNNIVTGLLTAEVEIDDTSSKLYIETLIEDGLIEQGAIEEMYRFDLFNEEVKQLLSPHLESGGGSDE